MEAILRRFIEPGRPFDCIEGDYVCVDCGKTFHAHRIVYTDTMELVAHATQCDDCWKHELSEAEKKQAEAMAKRGTEIWLSECGVPSSMLHARIPNWKYETDNQMRAINGAAEFVLMDYMSTIGFLGKTGRGKTHLCVGIMATLYEYCKQNHKRIPKARYVTEDIFYDELKSTYDKGRKVSEADILGEFKSYDLLVIDEIGRGGAADYMQNKLQRMLQDRVESPWKKTVIAGNVDKDQFLDIIGPAVASRIKEVTDDGKKRAASFYLDGEDYRSKKK